jgi:ABC-type Fe3+/spermidine/putrescine transport system ATPase subunit
VDDGASLELRGVTKRYAASVALDEVSLAVSPGELLFVLGPSGAGKSTLLRLIGGYDRPDRGDVMIGGRSVVDVPVHRRNIGMMFQSYALFPHMTVADNVGFGLRMRGVERPLRDERVRWALGLVRLDRLEARYPRELSGGQQQRVALARAIAFRPAVLLLDEPLASLDRRLRDEMRVELRQLQRTLGITTIFVTHDQEESLTMADRVVVMHRGAVQQVAAPAELYNRPANPFVASFVGEMNVLRGSVVGVSGACCEVQSGGLRFEVVPGWSVAVGDAVTVCIRAERIGLEVLERPHRGEVLTPALSQRERECGRVRFSSYLGASTLYLVERDDGSLLKVSERNEAGLARFVAGDVVTLSWPVGAAMVFPEDA